MYILKLILLLGASLFISVAESKELSSLKSHEAKLVKCLESTGRNSKCVASLIKDYLPDGNSSLFPVADKVEEVFIQWLDGESVANVYKTEDRNIGNFIIYRNYIVEDSAAGILLFEITYRKVLGRWYVLNFNINSKPAYISDKLKY